MSRIASKVVILSVIVFLMWSAAVQAGSLERRSRIGFRFGYWSQGGEQRIATQVNQYGVETTAKSGNVLIALNYAYWMQENLSVTFTLSALSGEVSSRVESLGVSTLSVGVAALLVGVRYYLPKPTLDTSFRPYLAASVGPYIGGQTKTEVGSQVLVESQTLTSFGANLGGGVDIELSRRFMADVNVGYNLTPDFSEPIGGRENYSGPEMSIGIGYLFGKGVQP